MNAFLISGCCPTIFSENFLSIVLQQQFVAVAQLSFRFGFSSPSKNTSQSCKLGGKVKGSYTEKEN